MNKFEINIGIFGTVSCGKSTMLNAIAGEQYSDTEIKKTTMVPQVYLEDESQPFNAQIIRHKNREANESVARMIDVNNFNTEQCQPLYHNVDKICDLFDPSIIEDELKINIYDIPGLNDSASKNIYFDWVRKNIHLFDIVIFMTELSRGLSNADEIDILNLLFESMSKYKIKMICLMNKCDDIYFDESLNDLVFEEKEQENIYLQANNILADIAKSYGFDCRDGSFTPFFPISSENCFIYRALLKNPECQLDQIHQNRLCKNECGPNQWKKMSNDDKEKMFRTVLANLRDTYQSKILDTGYLAVKSVIQKTIVNNKYQFLLNHVDNDLTALEKATLDATANYLIMANQYITKLRQIEKFGCQISYDKFWRIIIQATVNYATSVIKNNTKIIIRGRDFIDFKEFEQMHGIMEVACMNIVTLIDFVRSIPGYPMESISSKQNEIIEKLLDIYEQMFKADIRDQKHTCPGSLLYYLQVIKTYCPARFNEYALRFLTISTFPNAKYLIIQEKELLDLTIYVANNIDVGSCMNNYYTYVSAILIAKQVYTKNKFPDQYFEYLVRMKKMIKNVIKKLFMESYTAFDILYEVTRKNISIHLEENSVTSFYRLDIDYERISKIFTRMMENQAPADLDFENKFINLFVDKIN